MSIYITAQVIGFLGYLFFTTAPNFKNQSRIIQMDALACVFLCLQWMLLAQSALLILNLLNLAVSLYVLNTKNQDIIEKQIPILCLTGGIALYLVSSGSFVGMLCIIAFCAMVRAKSSNDISTFRSFSILAGIAFMLCGVIALSAPAIMFNAAFILVHLRKIQPPQRPFFGNAIIGVQKKLAARMRTNFLTQ